VFQSVRVRWGALECVGVWGSVLQCVAVCCSMLQYVAVSCSVLQCVGTQKRAIVWREDMPSFFEVQQETTVLLRVVSQTI